MSLASENVKLVVAQGWGFKDFLEFWLIFLWLMLTWFVLIRIEANDVQGLPVEGGDFSILRPGWAV